MEEDNDDNPAAGGGGESETKSVPSAANEKGNNLNNNWLYSWFTWTLIFIDFSYVFKHLS